MNSAPLEPLATSFRVGDWVAEPAWNRIRKAQRTVRLEPRVMRVLATLAATPGRPITRDQLIERVWGDVAVNEEALSRAISQLRQALGDDPRAPRYIQTVHKGGYCLVAATRAPPDARAEAQGSAGKRMLQAVAAVAVVTIVGLVLAARGIFGGSGPPDRGESLAVRPVTSDPGREFDPAISPDGKWVIYTGSAKEGFDLFRRPVEGGSPVRVTRDGLAKGHPAWSPDGSRIAFVASAGPRTAIYVVPASGGTPERLFTLASWSFGLDWSPDGRTLAYVDGRPNQPLGIALLDLRSKSTRILAADPSSSADVKPVFAPDGRSLAFLRTVALDRHRIVVAELGAAGRIRTLPLPPRQVRGLDWAPEGRSLVFSARSKGSFRLWRLALNGTNEPRLIPTDGEDLFNPSVSRNGRLVAEAVQQDRDVWRVASDGTHDAPFIRSTFDDYDAAFSADGQRVAFVSERSGNAEIWIADAAGRNPVQLTRLGRDLVGRPVWSPWGGRIAFHAGKDGGAAGYIVEVADGRTRLVDSAAGDVIPLGWGTREDELYTAKGMDATWRLAKRSLRRGAAAERPLGQAALAVVSPAGGTLLAVPPGRDRLLRMVGDTSAFDQIRLPAALDKLIAAAVRGTAIYLVQDNPAAARLYRMDAWGGPLHALGDLGFFDRPTLSVSRDGRWIVYTRQRETANDIVWLDLRAVP